MTLQFWNGQILFRYGKLAKDPACCCVAAGCPDAAHWSAVDVDGFSLTKGANDDPCAAGCGSNPVPAWADEVWYGYDPIYDVQHWVWSETVDHLGGPQCETEPPGYGVLYNYTWCECATELAQHTDDCCLALWNGSQFVLDNTPYTAYITP